MFYIVFTSMFSHLADKSRFLYYFYYIMHNPFNVFKQVSIINLISTIPWDLFISIVQKKTALRLVLLKSIKNYPLFRILIEDNFLHQTDIIVITNDISLWLKVRELLITKERYLGIR